MSFESLLINNLITNEEFTKKTIAYIKPEYFEDHVNRYLFNEINTYVNKYANLPSKEALAVIVSESKLTEDDYNRAVTVVSQIDVDTTDLKWLVDKSEEWAKERAVYNGIMEAIAIVNGDNKVLDKHAIPNILQQALAVSFDSYIGHSYFEQAEKQFDYYHSEEARFAFGIDILNRITKGGIKKKTLNVILAGINVGKSIYLVDQAAHWLLAGKNVAFFTLEMCEETVRERVDARMFDITFDDLHVLSKEQYMTKVRKMREQTSGDLWIKEFPTGGAHIGHFRHALEEWRIKRGFLPDLIVVDYLTIMTSSRLTANAKANSNTFFTSVAEELRSLGIEYDVPVWTAAQLDRSSQSAGATPDMANIAAAIGIAATADFMVVLTQPDEMIALNRVIGKCIKNRYNAKNKFRNFQLGLDVERQKFYDVEMKEQLHVVSDQETRQEILGMGMIERVDQSTGEVFSGWKI